MGRKLKEILAAEGLVAGRIPLRTRWVQDCIAAIESQGDVRATAYVLRPHEGCLVVSTVAPDFLSEHEATHAAKVMSAAVSRGFAVARTHIAQHSEILRLIRPYPPNTVFAGDVLSAEIYFSI